MNMLKLSHREVERMQEDRTPSCARLEQDSKGAKGHHHFNYLSYALNVLRCRKIEITTLNTTLLGRHERPKMRCVKCMPMCASARVALSNIVYL